MRILFMANAPWCTTGYGVQGKHLVPRLQALGHEIAYFAFYGLAGGVIKANGVTIFPMGTQPWGEDVLAAHMEAFGAQLLITLMDVWVTDFFGRKARRHGWAWCPWTPIDQEPVPDIVIERLEGAKFVLPYSRFGEKLLREAGVNNVRYVPHGVNTHVFRPGSRRASRQRLGLPEEAFIIGMVAANKGYPPRKCFPEQLLAFSRWKRRHPEAIMYLHTLKTDAHGGVDFEQLLKRLGLKEGKDVIFSNQYRYILGYPEEWMADLYRSFDILSLTSMGEGFGIPLIEAQACGVPVVTSNNSAMRELTFAGICVKRQHPFWTPLGSWAYLPDPDEIEDAYEKLYDLLQDPVSRDELRDRAVEGAKAFDWDKVVGDYWVPLLEELEGRSSMDECDRTGVV
jgi:glycosyltransferase involved in cell wall biosynthesis